MDKNFDNRELAKNNIIAKLLGEDLNDGKLKDFTGDTAERIGNIGEIIKRANEINDKSKDYSSVTIKQLAAGVKDKNLTLDLGFSTPNSLNFSNNGLSGLCNQLDIPITYIRKCLGEQLPEHAADEMNFWMERAENPSKELFVRTTEDRIHGILSNRYSVFDDHEVIEIAENILGPTNDYTIKNYYVDPEYMKMRIVSREKVEINGRPLSFGFDIKNSRVGRSSLELNVLVFDHICSNGMIFGGGKGQFYQKRHVGISRESFVQEFVDMIDKAPDTVRFIQRSINAAGNEVLNNDSIQRYLDKFKADNMSKLVAGLVEQTLAANYDRTVFGFASAVTEVAQRYSLDMRERMEKFAGNIIDLAGRKVA
jgi:hypothetical protein